MIVRAKARIPGSEITPPAAYFRRRKFIAVVGATALVGNGLGARAQVDSTRDPMRDPTRDPTGDRWRSASKSRYSTDEPQTPLAVATTSTRFRELEEDIAANGERFETRPWSVAVEGECLRPRTFDIDDLLQLAPIEERIYRMRCTEGFSHVVPYLGYPLSALLGQVQPSGDAKFLEFTSVLNRDQLKGQRDITYISWPYVEGLRIDEAMHPLTIVALGAYGRPLPKALGAPLAIRVPWKYGIKSPKAVVKIRLVAQQPQTVWTKHYPSYHSFWSNVNPDVSHSFWRSQASERRAGELLRRPTLPFNGYADQVAALYAGMNRKDTY